MSAPLELRDRSIPPGSLVHEGEVVYCTTDGAMILGDEAFLRVETVRTLEFFADRNDPAKKRNPHVPPTILAGVAIDQELYGGPVKISTLHAVMELLPGTEEVERGLECLVRNGLIRQTQSKSGHPQYELNQAA